MLSNPSHKKIALFCPSDGNEITLVPTMSNIRPADTHTPTFETSRPTCPLCIVHPDDKDEDECPIVTIGTCGDGKRG